MTAPVRLGIAGGPIVMGILIGALGPRVHFISYMTRSAGLMLRELGLALYLGCLGLAAGGQFFETVVRPEGLMWVGIGFLITVVPVVIVGLVILKTKKYDFGSICGILCGSMANPMALDLRQRDARRRYAKHQLCYGLSARHVYQSGDSPGYRDVLCLKIFRCFHLFLRIQSSADMKKGWFRLEISLSCYSHFLSRHRVLKCDFFCMKMQSCCRLVAVERIADDRGIQTFLMSTMHSQLVRSARFQDKAPGADGYRRYALRTSYSVMASLPCSRFTIWRGRSRKSAIRGSEM